MISSIQGGNLNCGQNKVRAKKVHGSFPLTYPGKFLLVKYPHPFLKLFLTIKRDDMYLNPCFDEKKKCVHISSF